MRPFDNEADVVSIGKLAIENRTDRISLMGDLDITRDKAGLRDARALKTLLDEVLAVLEGEDLPEKIAIAATKTTKNPFR
jgi:hypothetical protein